ncbi:ADP-ribosylglycohydrolase-domain-containing protein [Roridomyces roridus]|uniref:ADP-ribosylglycohydrolase-domain-containing protein n=1 Tax=Roridomyces roridus TaxID=1738132 RepID=A0AAD7C050_9AGAR|nr:ADP-ribosylglycohydrolase-domain-containing protein [Roridomyces roridus]
MNDPKILDRARGALFGSALGDAIGIYTEFMTAAQAAEAYGASPHFTLLSPETKFHNDTHRCRFENRAWTDDTDHTLLMMLSYLRMRELSPNDLAIRLNRWVTQGLRVLDRLPMGLGRTVGSVVLSPTYTSDPSSIALHYWEKGGRAAAPNGSLMRTAPVGVICIPTTEEATFDAAIRMGAVTHADPRCALSVAVVSALVRALSLGEITSAEQVGTLIERTWAYLQRPGVLAPDHASLLDRAEFERHAYAETLDALVLCDREMGYVYKCLGAGLWCLRRVLAHQDTFRSAMTTLVMYGGDADTNGAVAGALMGALVGYEKGLPVEWRDGMRHRDWYAAKVDALCCVAGLCEGVYDSENDQDTTLDGGRGSLSEEDMKKREMQIMEKMLLAEKERRDRHAAAQARPSSIWGSLRSVLSSR